MAYITYTARRTLVAGHVENDIYALVIELTPDTQRSIQDLKNTQISLDGSVETQFFGQVENWSVQIAPATLEEAEFIREFLDSTADGHVFTFDPYSMEETTSGWSVSVVRDDEGYTENRFMAIGNGGADDYIQFSFKVRSA